MLIKIRKKLIKILEQNGANINVKNNLGILLFFKGK